MNALNYEALRQRELAEARARENVNNNGNNDLVDDQDDEKEMLVPQQRQQVLRGAGQQPTDDEDPDTNGVGAIKEIVLPLLPPGVNLIIICTMLQLVNKKRLFRGAVGDDANQH